MSKLKELANKYLDLAPQEASQYAEFEDVVRGDKKNRLAVLAVEMLDSSATSWDEKEFDDLVGVLQEYQTGLEIPTIDYEFEPPTELLEEFGINQDTHGRLIITKEGERVEVNKEMEVVGPVSEANFPAEGHPEFNKKSTPVEEEMETDLEIPTEEYSVPMLPELTAIVVHLPDIGSVEYEVLDVVRTMYSIVLVFNPKVSKPSFYPKVGLVFDLEFPNGALERVMSSGTVFNYEGKKFICLARLDSQSTLPSI